MRNKGWHSMNWKELGTKIADSAPLLGSALGGPLGAGLGSIIAAAFGTEPEPDKVLAAIQMDPQAAVKLQEIQSNEKVRLQEIVSQQAIVGLQEETKKLQAVNETMQVESKSEHWLQWSWRPIWGLISAAAFFVVSSFVCYLAYLAIMEGKSEAMQMIPQLIGSMTLLFSVPGAILGVASWHRGKLKREEIAK